jgi:hypothetical protein
MEWGTFGTGDKVLQIEPADARSSEYLSAITGRTKLK